MTSDPQHLLPSAQSTALPTAKRHTVLFGAIGFLIGILAASALFSQLSRVPATTSENDSMSTSDGKYAANVISIQDQKAGSYVIIDSVNVPAPGAWVAVKETQGDMLGNVLGANWVPGPATHVTVNLLRDTLPGQTYAVVLYRDDGDGEFDVHKDSAYVDFDSGKSVVTFWKAK